MAKTPQDFLATLDREVLLSDGAKSSVWYSQGLKPANYAEQNISNPENVIKLHLDYINAGARIIETNTFRANRLQLARFNLESSVKEINGAGVRLVREAIRRSGREDIFIAGAVGPLGALVKPYGNLTLAELGQIYQQQIEVLYEEGVDILVIETHPSLLEALEAVRAARTLDTRPIVAQMTFLEDGLSKFGDEMRRSLEALAAADADVVGVNCGMGPSHMYNHLADFLRKTDLRVCVQPNAGLPQSIGGREVYLTSPDYLREYARIFVETGANIIGGCCGTTVEHIREMAKAVTGQVPRRKRSRVQVVSQATSNSLKDRKVKHPFTEKLGREFVTTVEIDPPAGLNYQPLIDQARRLLEQGIDAIQVTDNRMARVRMSSITFAYLLQLETAIEVILHFICRDRNLLAIQSELMGAAALGIESIIAMTGDPSGVGELPEATSVFDVNAAGLVRILRGLNQGITLAGRDITIPTKFKIGASVNPAAPNIEVELSKLQEKIDSGVDFVQTQPVFDIDLLERFAEKVSKCNIPVIAGLLPLKDDRHAEFLHNEVPGMKIPDWIRKRLSQAQNPADEGIAVSREILDIVRRLFAGAHIISADDPMVVEKLLLPQIEKKVANSTSLI